MPVSELAKILVIKNNLELSQSAVSQMSMDSPIFETQQFVPDEIIIFDCRWDYEYEGGNIIGSNNMFDGR